MLGLRTTTSMVLHSSELERRANAYLHRVLDSTATDTQQHLQKSIRVTPKKSRPNRYPHARRYGRGVHRIEVGESGLIRVIGPPLLSVFSRGGTGAKPFPQRINEGGVTVQRRGGRVRRIRTAARPYVSLSMPMVRRSTRRNMERERL